MSIPKCRCDDTTEMQFLMDNRTKEMFECPECGRLLLREKAGGVIAWYVPFPIIRDLLHRFRHLWRNIGNG